MNIPCATDPELLRETPISNTSSESPDVDLFYRRYYGYSRPPRVGFYWAIGCKGFCVSSVSQEAADECAQRQEIECNSGVGGGDGSNDRVLTIYSNSPQSCSTFCDDGNEFTYTVPAGIFYGFSQVEADQFAYNVACQRAADYKVCLSDLSDTVCCYAEPFSATITTDSTGAILWELVAGAIPSGMALAYNNSVGGSTNVLSGTPIIGGVYNFTIRCTNSGGYYMQKSYTLCVIEINVDPMGGFNDEFPIATNGTAYSVMMEAQTCAVGPLSWQVTDGVLPAGLTLDEQTGAITGTPSDVAGTYIFTITLQTEAT